MAERNIRILRLVLELTAWFLAQPGNETRTTDSSLKYLAAASDSGL